jgi:crotonobetainyl-CoA:carnitine CoA-transferase CaiB-like acyl-CoA transferase
MGPLSGVTVLDLGQFITGPHAGVLLAEMGADVIKIEPPAGDPFRGWDTPGFSSSFSMHNRGKRSVVLDLKTDEDRGAFLRLVETADVLIENFRPGVTARLGIDYDTVHARNPRLIYCSITGFGPDGPYRDRPSYDSVAQGLSGLNALLLDPDHPRLKGPAFGDTLTGLTAAYGIAAALAGRQQAGEGEHLEVNMLHSLAYFIGADISRYLVEGAETGPYSRPRQSQAFAFRASDDKLFLIHLSSPPKFWEQLCAAIGRADLLTDARFATRGDRHQHYDELGEQLQSTFATRPREEWLNVLIEHDVPCAPVYRNSEVPSDPQVRHLGIFDVDEDPAFGRIPRLRHPVRSSTYGASVLGRPPQVGEHNAEILGPLRAESQAGGRG